MNAALNMVKKVVAEKSQYSLPRVSCQIKLNQNENPYDLPDEIKEEILSSLRERTWNRYPELGSDSLRKTLGDWLEISENRILVGNGSNEVLLATLTTLLDSGKRIVTVSPTFSLYKFYGEILGASCIQIPLQEGYAFPVRELVTEAERSDTALTILCSPNNPTGNVLSENDIRLLLESANGYVLVDEAYVDFTEQNFLPLVDEYHNLILLRTFSKAFAFSFGRFGYGIFPDDLAKEVSKVMLPYNLGGFPEEAVQVLLRHHDRLQSTLEMILQEREKMYSTLRQMDWLTVFPSEANFLLLQPKPSASWLFEKLLSRGILVRDVSSYPGLGNHLRLTIGTPEENHRVVAAFRAIDREAREKAGRAPGQ